MLLSPADYTIHDVSLRIVVRQRARVTRPDEIDEDLYVSLFLARPDWIWPAALRFRFSLSSNAQRNHRPAPIKRPAMINVAAHQAAIERLAALSQIGIAARARIMTDLPTMHRLALFELRLITANSGTQVFSQETVTIERPDSRAGESSTTLKREGFIGASIRVYDSFKDRQQARLMLDELDRVSAEIMCAARPGDHL